MRILCLSNLVLPPKFIDNRRYTSQPAIKSVSNCRNLICGLASSFLTIIRTSSKPSSYNRPKQILLFILLVLVVHDMDQHNPRHYSHANCHT